MRPRFNAVCFDCDSTLSRIEGIDELGRNAGCEAEIAELTNAAMDGKIALDDVYGKRLDRVQPSRAALSWLGERYAAEVVLGAKETIATLLGSGVAVYVVSGGLLQPVRAFAQSLGIAAAHVHAVEVYFGTGGAYQGFDTSSPLASSNGKAIICRAIAAEHGSVAMVGDGVTDLSARAGGAYIVGYGGVVRRPAVERGADYYVSTSNLTATLAALLTNDEQDQS